MTTVDDAPEPVLPEPPGPANEAALRVFRALNRWCMVPACRAGAGAWLATPLGGWILLLRVRGRRSGLLRETPLNYVVAEGAAWVLAGFGPRTEWYRNLLAEPSVEAWLPGRRLACVATEVRDPATRDRIIPRVVRSTAVPSLSAGINPWTASDEEIARRLAWVPLIRLDPVGGPVAAGPDDPGGSAWIWRQATVIGATLVAACVIGRLLRRQARR
jgi:deazaflavin-dependent oxidoreductase (nitroreductase family)